MEIGSRLKEAFQKGLRALETGRPGWVSGATLADDRLTSDSAEDLRVALRVPTPERVFQIKRALEAGVAARANPAESGLDPRFPYQQRTPLRAQRRVPGRAPAGAR